MSSVGLVGWCGEWVARVVAKVTSGCHATRVGTGVAW